MIQHQDKQVKEFYNLVLRQVISTIREDPLINQAGIQSSVIDALEEKWRKNLQASKDAANNQEAQISDLGGSMYSSRQIASMGHPYAAYPLSNAEGLGYSAPQYGQPYRPIPRPLQPAGLGRTQMPNPVRTIPEALMNGGQVYQEDEDRRLIEQYALHNITRRREMSGFKPFDGSGANTFRMAPNVVGNDPSFRNAGLLPNKFNPSMNSIAVPRIQVMQQVQQSFYPSASQQLTRISSSLIGGNQNPPLLAMKRTDSNMAVRNEEPLNEHMNQATQEQAPLFQLALSFQDQGERSDGEDKVKNEDGAAPSKQEADQTQSNLHNTQPKPGQDLSQLQLASQIKLEGGLPVEDEEDDDDLFADSSENDKKKKPASSAPQPQTTKAPQQPVPSLVQFSQNPNNMLGKRELSDDEEDAEDEDGLFDQDGDGDAPPKIGDKLKKEDNIKKSKFDDKQKAEPPRNPRQEAVMEAIKPREVKVERSPSVENLANKTMKELCSEDDLSDDSEFDAGNNSLLGYFTKVGLGADTDEEKEGQTENHIQKLHSKTQRQRIHHQLGQGRVQVGSKQVSNKVKAEGVELISSGLAK